MVDLRMVDLSNLPPNERAALAGWMEAEKEIVKNIGEKIGYGRMMQLAQELWREKLEKEQPSLVGGEFAYGPCVSMTVPCECERTEENPHCDWCCGSGWLTEKVKKIKDAS